MTKQSEMAQRVLDKIVMYPDNFNMTSWVGGGNVLADQDAEGLCGTTLCVAGWAAHLEGWNLYSISNEAYRHGPETVDIAAAGFEALDMDIINDNLFYADEEVAIACLKRMASGEKYTNAMMKEEEEKEKEKEKEDME